MKDEYWPRSSWVTWSIRSPIPPVFVRTNFIRLSFLISRDPADMIRCVCFQTITDDPKIQIQYMKSIYHKQILINGVFAMKIFHLINLPKLIISQDIVTVSPILTLYVVPLLLNLGRRAVILIPWTCWRSFEARLGEEPGTSGFRKYALFLPSRDICSISPSPEK